METTTYLEVLIRNSKVATQKKWSKLNDAVEERDIDKFKARVLRLMGAIYHQEYLERELERITTTKT